MMMLSSSTAVTTGAAQWSVMGNGEQTAHDKSSAGDSHDCTMGKLSYSPGRGKGGNMRRPNTRTKNAPGRTDVQHGRNMRREDAHVASGYGHAGKGKKGPKSGTSSTGMNTVAGKGANTGSEYQCGSESGGRINMTAAAATGMWGNGAPLCAKKKKGGQVGEAWHQLQCDAAESSFLETNSSGAMGEDNSIQDDSSSCLADTTSKRTLRKIGESCVSGAIKSPELAAKMNDRLPVIPKPSLFSDDPRNVVLESMPLSLAAYQTYAASAHNKHHGVGPAASSAEEEVTGKNDGGGGFVAAGRGNMMVKDQGGNSVVDSTVAAGVHEQGSMGGGRPTKTSFPPRGGVAMRVEPKQFPPPDCIPLIGGVQHVSLGVEAMVPTATCANNDNNNSNAVVNGSMIQLYNNKENAVAQPLQQGTSNGGVVKGMSTMVDPADAVEHELDEEVQEYLKPWCPGGTLTRNGHGGTAGGMQPKGTLGAGKGKGTLGHGGMHKSSVGGASGMHESVVPSLCPKSNGSGATDESPGAMVAMMHVENTCGAPNNHMCEPTMPTMAGFVSAASDANNPGHGHAVGENNPGGAGTAMLPVLNLVGGTGVHGMGRAPLMAPQPGCDDTLMASQALPMANAGVAVSGDQQRAPGVANILSLVPQQHVGNEQSECNGQQHGACNLNNTNDNSAALQELAAPQCVASGHSGAMARSTQQQHVDGISGGMGGDSMVQATQGGVSNPMVVTNAHGLDPGILMEIYRSMMQGGPMPQVGQQTTLSCNDIASIPQVAQPAASTQQPIASTMQVGDGNSDHHAPLGCATEQDAQQASNMIRVSMPALDQQQRGNSQAMPSVEAFTATVEALYQQWMMHGGGGSGCNATGGGGEMGIGATPMDVQQQQQGQKNCPSLETCMNGMAASNSGACMGGMVGQGMPLAPQQGGTASCALPQQAPVQTQAHDHGVGGDGVAGTGAMLQQSVCMGMACAMADGGHHYMGGQHQTVDTTLLPPGVDPATIEHIANCAVQQQMAQQQMAAQLANHVAMGHQQQQMQMPPQNAVAFCEPSSMCTMGMGTGNMIFPAAGSYSSGDQTGIGSEMGAHGDVGVSDAAVAYDGRDVLNTGGAYGGMGGGSMGRGWYDGNNGGKGSPMAVSHGQHQRVVVHGVVQQQGEKKKTRVGRGRDSNEPLNLLQKQLMTVRPGGDVPGMQKPSPPALPGMQKPAAAPVAPRSAPAPGCRGMSKNVAPRAAIKMMIDLLVFVIRLMTMKKMVGLLLVARLLTIKMMIGVLLTNNYVEEDDQPFISFLPFISYLLLLTFEQKKTRRPDHLRSSSSSHSSTVEQKKTYLLLLNFEQKKRRRPDHLRSSSSSHSSTVEQKKTYLLLLIFEQMNRRRPGHLPSSSSSHLSTVEEKKTYLLLLICQHLRRRPFFFISSIVTY